MSEALIRLGLVRHVLAVEAMAVLALMVGAAALAGMASLHAAMAETSMLGVQASAEIVFTYACFLGVLPVVFYAAPVYLVLHATGKATWLTVLCIPVIPAIIGAAFDRELAISAAIVGTIAAAITHLTCRSRTPPP